MIGSRPLRVALWLAIAVQYVLCLGWFAGLTMGDGFIVARYAENLVDHGELAFNLGERIWSFTSPLHVLLVAAYYAVTGSSIASNQVASIACVLVAFALVARCVCRDETERLFAAVVVLLSPCLIFWTTAGLETAHLTLLIAAVVVVALRTERARPGAGSLASVLWLGALCGLSALTFLCRYDAVLFVFPIVLFAFSRVGVTPATLAAALPALALVGGWMAFAHGYYDDFFPTSFYTKTPTFRSGVSRNAIYEIQFLVLSALPLAWLAVRRGSSGSLEANAAEGRGRGGRGSWGLWVGLLLVFIYGLSAATKHMMFGYRLFLPYLPALLAATLQLRPRRPREGEGASHEPAGVAIAICIAAMVGQALVMAYLYGFGVNPSFVGEFRHFSAERMQRFSNEIWEPLTDDVRRHWARHPDFGTRAPRLYTWEAGQMPYRMRELHVYDNGLISWRHRCEFSSMASADYVLIWPSNPKPPGRMEVVTAREAPSQHGPGAAGGGSFVLYFTRTPQRHRLPAGVDEPCAERPWIRDRPPSKAR